MAQERLTAEALLEGTLLEETRFTVLIPYFQRGEGLLADALRSVFDQSVVAAGAHLHVIVVDDHSPRDPHVDIESLAVPSAVKLQIIRTPVNGGPAAARNFALDTVSVDAGFVAFLDSDEVWTPRHLENALLALTLADADVYFSNYLRREWPRDKFTTTGFGAGHQNLDSQRQLYRFEGDPLRTILLDANVRIQTCVVRWSALMQLRFRTELAIGEDSDYVAAAVTKHRAALCFTRLVETIEERPGVNVSQNIGGDPTKEVDIRSKMLQYQKHVLHVYGNRGNLHVGAQQAVGEARYNLLQSLTAAGPSVLQRARALLRAASIDRGFPVWAMGFCVTALLRRVTGNRQS